MTRLLVISLMCATLPLWAESRDGSAGGACLSGSSRDQRLIKAFNNTALADNEPIRMWRNSRAQRADSLESTCQAINNPIINVAISTQRILSSVCAQGIKVDCVAQAMTNIDNIAKIEAQGKPTRSVLCKSTSDSSPLSIPNAAPCINREMANYTTWITNQSLTCLSPEDDPLDPRVTFTQLNNESAFGFFLDNRNGRGLGQFTAPAEKEMMRAARGYPMIDQIKTLLASETDHTSARYKACSAFASALSKVKSGDKRVPICQFAQPGNGLAFSAFLHTAFMLYLRDNYNAGQGSATAAVKKLGLDPKTDPIARELRDQLTLVYYSSAGPGRGRAIFESTAAQIRKSIKDHEIKPKQKAEMTLALFRRKASLWYDANKQANYLDAIDDRNASLLRDMGIAPADGKAYSARELKGDACVE